MPGNEGVVAHMMFSSVIFVLLFLPITLALYFLPLGRGGVTRGDWWKNSVLLLVSFFSYTWGEGAYVLLILGCIAWNWLLGIALSRAVHSPTAKHGKAILILGIASNLLLLAYFKYAAFIFANLFAPFPGIAAEVAPALRNVHLPIGISFFTFQLISYLVDVWRKEIEVQWNPLKLCLYITFFPHLIAGPIVRYRQIAKEIDDRTHTLRDFSYGVQRFIIGLGQKVILANTLGQVSDKLYDLPLSQLSTGFAWAAALSYTFQIYYDFCGYSNMAIGMARMFGFRFLENFDHPYVSQSITEFWRRWHISLSTWFRDYLYIPLGGNRGGTFRTYRNLLIVFFLCGLWHGASWNFVVWGLIHGALLIFERTGAGRMLLALPRPVRHFYTMLCVMIGWVFFRLEHLDQALVTVGRMFGIGEAHPQLLFAEVVTPEVMLCWVLAALFSVPLPVFRIGEIRTGQLDRTAVEPAHFAPPAYVLCTHLALLVCGLGYLASGTFNPFIYFRF